MVGSLTSSGSIRRSTSSAGDADRSIMPMPPSSTRLWFACTPALYLLDQPKV